MTPRRTPRYRVVAIRHTAQGSRKWFGRWYRNVDRAISIAETWPERYPSVYYLAIETANGPGFGCPAIAYQLIPGGRTLTRVEGYET